MAVDAREIWGLADVLSTPQGGAPRTMTGTVDSVDDQGTAWVSVPGSDAPVPAAVTADAEPGDVVTVTVADGRAAIEGNATSPAATVRGVGRVDARVDAVQADVAEAAQVAEEAAAVASATNQHFWARSTDPYGDGAGTGAFVTDEEQADFLAAIAAGTEPTEARPLHNLLMNSLGILLRTALKNLVSITRSAIAFFDGEGNDAANVVASFGKDGAQIGKAGGVYVALRNNKFELNNADSFKPTQFGLLNDADTGLATLEESQSATYLYNGGTLLGCGITASSNIHSLVSVTLNGSEAQAEVVSGKMVVVDGAAYGDEVTAVYTTKATVSFAQFGRGSTARGVNSFASGTSASANGQSAFAEGDMSQANGFASHAEGSSSSATGYASHAEGQSDATGNYAHSEGYHSTSEGSYSHAEGFEANASGYASHAEGGGTMASGMYSHAQNRGTKSASANQTALGKFNVEDANGDYAVIIGNGTSDSARSNALTVDWQGNVECGTVNGVDVTAIPVPQSGAVTMRAVAAGSVDSVAVTFATAFDHAPNVVCCLQSTQTQLMGNCSCVVTARSATGFTVALVNNSTSARNIGCCWIAL